jgi:hypothetical protein
MTGLLTFTLAVTDPFGLSDGDDTTVLVTNQAPVGDAGGPQTVLTGTQVTLDGSGSRDPDGDPLTYAWTQTAGTAVTLSDPEAVKPGFTAPAAEGVLAFTLVVTDPFDLSDSDRTTVTVAITLPNQPPVAHAGPDRTAGINTTVTLDGRGSMDPDGHYPLHYHWAQSGGPTVRLSDAAVVTPTFTTPGAPAVLTFTLAVTDSLGLAGTVPDRMRVSVPAYGVYLPVVLRGR